MGQREGDACLLSPLFAMFFLLALVKSALFIYVCITSLELGLGRRAAFICFQLFQHRLTDLLVA